MDHLAPSARLRLTDLIAVVTGGNKKDRRVEWKRAYTCLDCVYIERQPNY
jgi:hypothetical protein